MNEKILGAVLIIAIATAGGFLIARRFSGRTREIRQLENLILYIETEILYGATPLNLIMERVALREKGPLANIFHQIAERMKERGPTFRIIWEEEMQKGWPKTYLQKEELKIMLQLGASLGISDRIDQQNHLRLALTHLKEEESKAQEEQAKYEKLSRTLGFLTGVLIVILMY